MNGERIVAGIFVGLGALLLIYQGRVEVAAGLLGGMLGFFVGESNGKRTAKTNNNSTS